MQLSLTRLVGEDEGGQRGICDLSLRRIEAFRDKTHGKKKEKLERDEAREKKYFYEDGKESKVGQERNARKGLYASNAFV